MTAPLLLIKEKNYAKGISNNVKAVIQFNNVLKFNYNIYIIYFDFNLPEDVFLIEGLILIFSTSSNSAFDVL